MIRRLRMCLPLSLTFLELALRRQLKRSSVATYKRATLLSSRPHPTSRNSSLNSSTPP
ncbi:unnamed protein product [Strongylus vulgaris]|uniref:Uncharacterized protein n=1 Tax=Strongylus vulgaris TaxID=40348 RepID=A0A3P7L176_STRVU|nr:unnamed protein product [Strongylus vulgaris]